MQQFYVKVVDFVCISVYEILRISADFPAKIIRNNFSLSMQQIDVYMPKWEDKLITN